MTSALKLRVEENIDHLVGKSRTHNSAAHAKNVGVIVKSRKFSAEIIRTASRTNALDFVGSHADADTRAAAKNSENFLVTVRYCVTYLERYLGIVDRIGAVSTVIGDFISADFFKVLLNGLLELISAVIGSDCYFH